MNKRSILTLELSLLLGVLPFTNIGCRRNSNYPILSDCEEDISYQKLCDSSFLVLDDLKNNHLEYYLASVDVERQENRFTHYDYYDILTDKNVYYEFYDGISLGDKSEDKNLVDEVSVEEYLEWTNNVQDDYSIEDAKNILNKMKDFYLSSNGHEKRKVLKRKSNYSNE